MPRDLFPPQEPVLTQSPEPQDLSHDSDLPNLDGEDRSAAHEYAIFGGDDLEDRELELSNAFRRKDDLHPFVQALSISDIDACVAVENAAFPEHERCSREKFRYRLTVCPSLCLGVFSSTDKAVTADTKAAYDAAKAPDSATPSHKTLLIGQVIATLSSADRVTDASMELPQSFKPHPNFKPQDPVLAEMAIENDTSKSDPAMRLNPGLPSAEQSPDSPGHHPLGRTLCIHSVCILPNFQGSGLGKMLLRSYLQRMEGSGLADRVALLAHPELIPWYTDVGFTDNGESKVKFGGGGWHDLTYEFEESGPWS